MKRMLDRIGFDTALRTCGLPEPGSNRGYPPEQLSLFTTVKNTDDVSHRVPNIVSIHGRLHNFFGNTCPI